MKKALLIALLLTLSMGTAIAKPQHGSGPPPGNGPGRGGEPVAHLTEQLGLDELQVADVTAIFEETKLLREEERERTHEAFCEIQADTHSQVLAVLTTEQQVLFEEMLLEKHKMRKELDEARLEQGFGGGREKLSCDG